MLIDFFEEGCKSTSSQSEFGLCDDPPPSTNHAYIDENNPTKWIGIVKNKLEKHVHFFAIDRCIELLRSDGNLDNRCDGMLQYDNSLLFIELKARKKRSGQWVKHGSLQIKTTIQHFKNNHNIELFDKVKAHVCNQLKPLANQSHAVHIQKFKNETGLILKVQQEILIGT